MQQARGCSASQTLLGSLLRKVTWLAFLGVADTLYSKAESQIFANNHHCCLHCVGYNNIGIALDMNYVCELSF